MHYVAALVTFYLSSDFKDFNILMIGRLLGGISTSLLFSIFEAWMIRAHSDAQLKNYIGKSFSWAAFCNSIVAVLTGLVANKAAESFDMKAIQDEWIYIGGYLSPFDIALVTSIMTAAAAYFVWEENYGEKGSSADASKEDAWYEGLRSSYRTMIRSQDILLCGIISSLFEGSMYVSHTHTTIKTATTSSIGISRISCLTTLFRFSFSCGRLPCRTETSYPLDESLPHSWFAAWPVAVFSVSLATRSEESSLECMFLQRQPLPWA